MDPNELLKMLDLNAKPARPPNNAEPVVTSKTASPETSEPKSLTALELDEWGLRRGRDLIAESDRLRVSVTKVGGFFGYWTRE